MWNGALSFGLINIPIRLYSAVEERGGISFDMLHKQDLSPIRYARICKEEGKEIPYSDIVKGYKDENGEYVVMSDEDFQKADVQKTKAIDILDFIEEKEIDSIYYEKPYFLEPGKGADKAYVLLRDALSKSKKVGLGRFVFHTREHLAVIRPYGNLLLLEQLRFASEIRDAGELKIPKKAETSEREINMALKLIDQLTSHFKPQAYHDTYTEELQKLIEDKAKGKKVKVKKGKESKIVPMTDIMHLLKESLEKSPRRKAA